MKLEAIAAGQNLTGIEPETIVEVIATKKIGSDSVQLYYTLPDAPPKETLLDRGREATIEVATSESPWSFDGDGNAFQLAVEAKRMQLAFWESIRRSRPSHRSARSNSAERSAPGKALFGHLGPRCLR